MTMMRKMMTSEGAIRAMGFTSRVALTLLTIAVGAGGALGDGTTVSAQETFRLVSAQVVTAAGSRPPLLRLAANGPIAFQALTPEESGLPAGSPRLAVRLYGVRPGELATLGGLDPFSLVVTASGTDAIVHVGLAADATLRVRAGRRMNELEVIASPAP